MNESRQTGFAFSELTGGLQLKDYIQVAKRRKRCIVLPALAIFVLALAVSLRLPSTYRAETKILVDPQKVANALVASPQSSVVDRLGLIRQQVLAQSRLKKLIETMNLYPELKGKIGDQEILQKMSDAIDVEMVQTSGMPMNAFRIAYKGNNPVTVAQVTNQLASLFIEENLKDRENKVLGTKNLLEDELEKTRQQLADKEKEIAKVKSANLMESGDSQSYHIEMLNNLRAQLTATQDRINRAQQQRVYLQSMAATSAPSVDLDQNQSPYRQQLQRLLPQLSELTVRYGPKHPDVVKLQAQVNDLKAKAEQDERNAPPIPAPSEVKSTTRNPVLAAQLQRLDQEIAEQSANQDRIQKQIQDHSAKLGQFPIVQQKLTDLSRDYDTLKAHYTQLLNTKLNNDTVVSIEDRQQGERFVILDPAQVPEKPYSPNRPLIAAASLAVGLILGIGLAVILELLDSSVRSEKEAETLYGKPVLVGVPRLYTQSEKKRGRIVDVSATAATVLIAAVVGYGIGQITARML